MSLKKDCNSLTHKLNYSSMEGGLQSLFYLGQVKELFCLTLFI